MKRKIVLINNSKIIRLDFIIGKYKKIIDIKYPQEFPILWRVKKYLKGKRWNPPKIFKVLQFKVDDEIIENTIYVGRISFSLNTLNKYYYWLKKNPILYFDKDNIRGTENNYIIPLYIIDESNNIQKLHDFYEGIFKIPYLSYKGTSYFPKRVSLITTAMKIITKKISKFFFDDPNYLDYKLIV